MNVLMINYEFPPLGGGAANANYYLLKEFNHFDYLSIDLVTASTGGFKILDFGKKIKIHYIDIKKNINKLNYQSNKDLLRFTNNAMKYCRALIKNKEYDLIHAFFGIPCGYMAMKLGLPYIVSLRGSDVPFYNKRFLIPDLLLFKNLSRKIWKKSEFTAANSKGLKTLANRTNPSQKIEVIYNGIDIKEFKPGIKKDNGILKILSVGRLIKRKGYEYLIKALSGIKNIQLTLIGDGNIKVELIRLAKSLNINADFLGRIEHSKLHEHYNDADVFALPSLNEGMSNSILEAMACGLPVIATDVGGAEELVKNNGFIVKRADSDELKKAVLNYLNDRDLIHRHSAESRRLAESLSWQESAGQYFGLYKKITDTK